MFWSEVGATVYSPPKVIFNMKLALSVTTHPKYIQFPIYSRFKDRTGQGFSWICGVLCANLTYWQAFIAYNSHMMIPSDLDI